MKIKLNGYISILGEHAFFDDFEIKIGDDLDLPFNDSDEDEFECDIEKYIEDCEDCGFCDCEDEEEEYTNLLNKYARIIQNNCVCPECLKELLDKLIGEFLDLD